MIAASAKRMGLYVTVLDPTPNCPAAGVSDEQIVADFKDENAIRQLGEKSDTLTFELELANANVLRELNNNGCRVHPGPETLFTIQNKQRQKTFLKTKGLPIPTFKSVSNANEAKKVFQDFNNHAMLKMAQDSYDGRGNMELNTDTDWNTVEKWMNGKECFVEEWIPYQKELSVMVARNEKGEVATYPVSENIHTESILDTSIHPARVSEAVRNEADRVARETVEKLQGSGVFGIEMFLTNENTILINEVAPRVHNSGHYTLEACKTSQFNQHVRAVLNWPLGSTQQIYPAVMVNILGKSPQPFALNGLSRILAIDGAYLHIYGKHDSKPKRKMGHVTIIDSDLNAALQKSQKVKQIIAEEVK